MNTQTDERVVGDAEEAFRGGCKQRLWAGGDTGLGHHAEETEQARHPQRFRQCRGLGAPGSTAAAAAAPAAAGEDGARGGGHGLRGHGRHNVNLTPQAKGTHWGCEELTTADPNRKVGTSRCPQRTRNQPLR